MSPKGILFVLLAVFGLGYLAVWAAQIARARRAGRKDDPATDAGAPSVFQLAVGFVTNFFDTLGIGSFATTTTIYRLRRAVPDRLIPGTLNVGHTLPTFAQAFFFIYVFTIEVQFRTMALLIAASVGGAWLGAGIVARWSKRRVQIGMGSALLVAALLMLGSVLKLFPAGGDTLGLSGGLLALGLVGCFAFGALMTIGIGAYAPIMIMVSLLGMNPKTAFPIMMGACAFLMPVASAKFIRADAYSLRAALGLCLGGIPAVLLAAIVVKSLPLDVVRWLVVAVVIYTGFSMLRAAQRERDSAPAPGGTARPPDAPCEPPNPNTRPTTP